MEKRNLVILIDYAKCPPCSGLICVGVCPMGVLEVGENNKPQVIDTMFCTCCGVCADLCPSKAIIIKCSEQSRDRGREANEAV